MTNCEYCNNTEIEDDQIYCRECETDYFITCDGCLKQINRETGIWFTIKYKFGNKETYTDFCEKCFNKQK
jgi:hypothetical protein